MLNKFKNYYCNTYLYAIIFILLGYMAFQYHCQHQTLSNSIKSSGLFQYPLWHLAWWKSMGKNKKINVTGSLNRYRDFVYISDTVTALLKKPKSKNNWILNLGTGKKTKVKEVINLIKNISQIKNLKIIQKNSFKEDTWGSYANNHKLRSEGWRPKVNLKLGAKLTIKHEIENKLF